MTRALALVAAALLAACGQPILYAQLEARSVAITQTLPPLPGAPQVDAPATALPSEGFDLNLGEIDLGAESEKSSVTLNGAVFEVVQAASPQTTFAGVRRAELILLPAAGSAAPPVTLALFDRDRDGVATTRLALRPVGEVNLLPYLSSNQVRAQVIVAGTPPGPAGSTWEADLTVDLHLLARVEVR